MSSDSYTTLAMKVLAEASVVPRAYSAPSIVLQRIARGGGATDWFVCTSEAHLHEIAAWLSPGSVVSFYFDDRIKLRRYSMQVRQEILRIAGEDRACVVGTLNEDGYSLSVDYVAGPSEMAEFEQDLQGQRDVYFGPFPGRDNDGKSAITVVLPDKDGVVRAHPH